MFKFHSLAFKNAKSQLIKTILFSLVSFIIAFVAFVIARTFFVQNFMQMQLAAQFQQSAGASLVMIILVLVLGLLFFILAGYQLLAGAFNIMAKAIEKEAVQFSDLFFAFKKGKYVKSLLLALITIILYAVLYLITLGLNFLFNKALTPLFTSIQQSVSTSDHAIGILLTVQIILIIIMGFILSIVYWFFFILMINYTVSFARKNDLSAIGHFKDGFKGIKNGRKTWFKFFLAILLINLLIIIITQPLGTILTVLTGNMSQNVAQVILIIAQTLIIIVRLILYFIILMGIVQYFLRRGENVNRPVKEKKKIIKKKR
ncbi:YtxH domain-containing protein [Staphylococcus hominis]|uniref:YtxH domain-containing protein n=1 Tax=Staphylococcus hominis TaxID=1290 RepID=UPI00200E31D3|nr:YtxH domain-containing protein [Staphylococcus hominis]